MAIPLAAAFLCASTSFAQDESPVEEPTPEPTAAATPAPTPTPTPAAPAVPVIGRAPSAPPGALPRAATDEPQDAPESSTLEPDGVASPCDISGRTFVFLFQGSDDQRPSVEALAKALDVWADRVAILTPEQQAEGGISLLEDQVIEASATELAVRGPDGKPVLRPYVVLRHPASGSFARFEIPGDGLAIEPLPGELLAEGDAARALARFVAPLCDTRETAPAAEWTVLVEPADAKLQELLSRAGLGDGVVPADVAARLATPAGALEVGEQFRRDALEVYGLERQWSLVVNRREKRIEFRRNPVQ